MTDSVDELWRCHAPGSDAYLRLTPEGLTVAGDLGVAVRHPWSSVGRVDCYSDYAVVRLPGRRFRLDASWGDWEALADRIDEMASEWAREDLRQRRLAKTSATFEQAIGLAPGELVRCGESRMGLAGAAACLAVTGAFILLRLPTLAGYLDVGFVLVGLMALLAAPLLAWRAWRNDTRRLSLSHDGLFVREWGHESAYGWTELVFVSDDAIEVRGRGRPDVFVGTGTSAQRRILSLVRRSVQARDAGFDAPPLLAVPPTALSRLSAPAATGEDRGISVAVEPGATHG